MAKFPPSTARRMYWSTTLDAPHRCPECGRTLEVEYHVYAGAFTVKGSEQLRSMTMGGTGGAFCPRCPVVVLKRKEFGTIVERWAPDVDSFTVFGIVDVEALPPDQREHLSHMDDLKITRFLPQVRSTATPAPETPAPAPKAGRNDPCPCGSGRKYKKCCGGGAG